MDGDVRDGEQGPTRRRPGRPRDDGLTDLILAVTTQLVTEHGVERLRVQDVADRAGVGLATIYRRWPTKTALVVDAVRHDPGPLRLDNTDDAVADLTDLMTRMSEALAEPRAQRLALMATLIDEPEIRDAVRESQIPRLRAHLRDRVAAVVGPDAFDLDLIADVGPALVWSGTAPWCSASTGTPASSPDASRLCSSASAHPADHRARRSRHRHRRWVRRVVATRIVVTVLQVGYRASGGPSMTSPSRTAHAVCRACHVGCALQVELTDGVPTKVYGAKDNPAHHGYSCIKGRRLAAYHSLPTRLLHSQRRAADGELHDVAAETALDEIAERIGAIVAEHGPRAVALYTGTLGAIHPPASAFARAFLRALGSPMDFHTMTIDQPGNAIAPMLHGPWMGGMPTIDESDLVVLVGTNPLVSLSGGLGPNPARQVHRARERGLKMIVIDPRRTETAAKADLHLAVRPGEDPVLLAGIARALLTEGLHDRAFVDAEAVGVDALRAALEPFTPEVVAERTGVPAAAVLTAARMLSAARRGGIRIGTGSNMSGRPTLSVYLTLVLTTLSGLWRRAGERVPNPGVLVEHGPWIAASPGPLPASGFGERLRVKGFTDTVAGLPTAALPEEILLPGDGRVRALIVLGGNPALAIPDQRKVAAALADLDLLVCIDPHVSRTAESAHYVLAPTLPLEQVGVPLVYEFAGVTGVIGFGWGAPEPYQQYAGPVVEPPPGSDLRHDWEFFHGLARRLGLELSIPSESMLDRITAAANPTPVDMVVPPTEDDVWRMLTKGSPVPFDEVRANAGAGRRYDRPEVRVGARPAGWPGRLDVGNATMLAELADALALGDRERHPRMPFRLLGRRVHELHNSNWHDDPTLRRRHPTNPARMNPGDLARLGLADGGLVEIRSAHDVIVAVAAADDTLAPGCVAMTHCFGTNPGSPDDPATHGVSTGRLVSLDVDFDPVTGIPRMGAVPVDIHPHRDGDTP